MAWKNGKSPSLFLKKVRVENKKRMEKTADWLLDAFIRDSPVDTGRFKERWKVTGHYPLMHVTNNARSDKGYPYPIRLEQGYSRQAPNGVVLHNLASVKALLRSGNL